MNYISLAVAILLISAYLLLNYLQIKKLKKKLLLVIEGKVENNQLSKLIGKAHVTSKNRFALFMLYQFWLMGFFITIFTVVIDVLIRAKGFDIIKYLFMFLFLSIVFTIVGIVRANSIWNLSR